MIEKPTLHTYNERARRSRAGLIQPTSFTSLEPILNDIIGIADEPIYQASVNLTSQQASALLRADEVTYNSFARTEVNVPEVSHLSLDKRLANLSPYNQLPNSIFTLSEEEIVTMITGMITASSRFFPDHVYTPFFQDSSPESQIDISPLITDLTTNLRRSMGERLRQADGKDELIITSPQERKVAEVIDSITYGNLLPTSVAASNRPLEFDSDEVNLMQVTAFGRGDKVVILAEYNDYALVSGGDGYGWVSMDQLATQEDQASNQNAKEVMYSAGAPFFFTGINGGRDVILPGDTIYETDGIYAVLQRDETTSSVKLHPLTDLPKESTTERLITPQEVVQFLYDLSVPYIRGIFDCSEIYRRVFKLLGYQVGKYSGNIIGEVNNALGNQEYVIDNQAFSSLEDGLYLSNIYDDSHSKHMSLLVMNKGKLEIYSYTHDQEDAAYEQPHILGRHIVYLDAYLEKIGKYRASVLQITQQQ